MQNSDLDTLKMVREALWTTLSPFANNVYFIPPHIMRADALKALDALIARMEQNTREGIAGEQSPKLASQPATPQVGSRTARDYYEEWLGDGGLF